MLKIFLYVILPAIILASAWYGKEAFFAIIKKWFGRQTSSAKDRLKRKLKMILILLLMIGTAHAQLVQVGTSANVSTVSTNQYRFYPGITSVANVDFNAFVAPTYRIRATLISGTSQVFSIGGWTIP
jgi:hypothetical protein